MEKLKQIPAAPKRLICFLLALICMLGLLPNTAFAAGPNTIVMEDCTHNGVYYESAALSTCWLHQMKFDFNGDTVMGFCADHGGGMGWSLEGHEWNNPREITDPTVKTMMAYFYAHSRGIFTDQAKALGVDETWSSDYTWTMNAWVQAVVWRYQENLFSDPVAACAEELMYVYNNLEHTSYSSIDDVVDGTTLRDRAQYILDLGAQGVWGDCTVYEYDYAGPGTAQHPAYDVQGIIIGDLTVTRERYQFTIKKVDATNPNLALPGARFLVQNANGTFEKEVVTGRDGTVTLTNLEASTYSVTELDPPEDYQIDNPGPQYVVLPDSNGETVVVTFTDTPIITSEGSIRKVDADDPTKGLAGAVIKIEGVDNEFTGTYITGAGGYLEDVPWDAMPIGSFVATELTPPNGYTTSSDPDKVRQEFYWDGKHDVDLIFENDAKVKVQLIKLDDSDNPIEGAVFNVVKDGQVIATEATDATGSIIVPNVTEGMYAFFEVSVPAPYAKLQQPVIAHVDQATVDGGGTVTVTAVDQMLPTLTILKRDGQTGEVVPGAVFEVKGIHHGYHTDVTTGPDGTAALTGLPVDSYEVTEISVPDPYVVAAEPTQTIWLGPGDNRQLIFDNLKQPQLTIAKVDAADSTTPIPGTVFRIEAIDGDYQHDVTTGQDGTVTLRVQPGTYQITELSVPAPYYLPDKDADRVQTITLNAGDEKEVVFKDHMGAGVETRPFLLPPLQKQAIRQVVPECACFYTAKSVKQLDNTEMNKTIFTRLTGAIFSPGYCYAVYNTRDAVMKWSGMGEFKTARHLEELARMNAGPARADHAILLGEHMDLALQTLLESDKSRRMELRFDRIYPHVHFIPMTEQGTRLLRILTLPDWHEQVLTAVFPEGMRVTMPGVMEYDAQNGDTLILSHLDGDIARLVRVRQALEHSAAPYEILCYPWQSQFVDQYMGGRAQLREISMPDLEEALGIGGGEMADEGS